MRYAKIVLNTVLMFGSLTCAAQEPLSESTPAPRGGLQIEIQSPAADFAAVEGETSVEVDGIASAIGGVRYLDMVFVMDTSQSLRNTDPEDYRSAGAIGLVRNLSPKSDIQIGVVSFNAKGEIAQPMTSDRDRVAQALRRMAEEALPLGLTSLATSAG